MAKGYYSVQYVCTIPSVQHTTIGRNIRFIITQNAIFQDNRCVEYYEQATVGKGYSAAIHPTSPHTWKPVHRDTGYAHVLPLPNLQCCTWNIFFKYRWIYPILFSFNTCIMSSLFTGLCLCIYYAPLGITSDQSIHRLPNSTCYPSPACVHWVPRKSSALELSNNTTYTSIALPDAKICTHHPPDPFQHCFTHISLYRLSNHIKFSSVDVYTIVELDSCLLTLIGDAVGILYPYQFWPVFSR